MPSGIRWQVAAGTATYSANAPSTVSPVAPQPAQRLPRPARQGPQAPQNRDGSTATRSPTARPAPTSGPSATTSPANSCPGTIGYGVGGKCPSAMCRSVPQIPHAPTRTTTSPGPGTGSGTSATRTVPGSSTTTARIPHLPLI